MGNIIDFEEKRELRVLSNGRLWERLSNYCIPLIEECMGEILPCVQEEETRILAELRRRNTYEANEIRSAYATLRLITIKQQKKEYREIINV